MEKPKRFEVLSELNHEMEKILNEREAARQELDDIFTDAARRTSHHQAKLVEE